MVCGRVNEVRMTGCCCCCGIETGEAVSGGGSEIKEVCCSGTKQSPVCCGCGSGQRAYSCWDIELRLVVCSWHGVELGGILC